MTRWVHVIRRSGHVKLCLIFIFCHVQAGDHKADGGVAFAEHADGGADSDRA
jgi:hypothetical protein